VALDLTEQLQLDETRRDLVANVSHELRSPLTAIRGYAENLRDGALEEPATAARFLDRILAQCQRLEALLEDLLALSRLERDEPSVLEPGVDLAALTARSIETVRGLAAERRVELRFTPSPVPPIVGDEESLERLLLNLLENAIKYNREGGWVAVTLELGDGGLALEVADSGIGVPQRDLRRIFERFYRVDSGRSREEGGTGLGLAIVKHAAQLHGGRVEVTSELGRGSVFRVFLPVMVTDSGVEEWEPPAEDLPA
jgi:two-component system phosphate regulon sensor histidine kinase PhoR